MSAALASPPLSNQDLLTVPIEIPKRTHAEPRIEGMAAIVKSVAAATARRGPLQVPRSLSRVPYNPDADERVKQHKVDILKEVARQLDGKRDSHYALFVFAIFRFGLTMKHLSWMGSALDLTDLGLRRLCTEAQRSRGRSS